MMTAATSRRGWRWARGALPAVLATVAIVLSATPAHADSPVAHVNSSGWCAEGNFYPHDEIFQLWDSCSDGHSAVLRVDVAPIQSGGGYDFLLWNQYGKNKAMYWNRSYKEGKGICIQAGIGEYGSKANWDYGRWDCTAA